MCEGVCVMITVRAHQSMCVNARRVVAVTAVERKAVGKNDFLGTAAHRQARVTLEPIKQQSGRGSSRGLLS